jgi:hypothetical protein
MVSQSGLGWGKVQYTIRNAGGGTVYTGSLLGGSVGVDDNCFTQGECYDISTSSDPKFESDVVRDGVTHFVSQVMLVSCSCLSCAG